MRKNFGAKAILYTMPILIIGTYDENGKSNAMNVAWDGISEETQISICVDDEHKTAKNVVKTGGFYCKYCRCRKCCILRLCWKCFRK